MDNAIVPEMYVCPKCQLPKPREDYYTRSGSDRPYLAECKMCHRKGNIERRRKKGYGRSNPGNQSELDVIAYLRTFGIPAFPGKTLIMGYVDVVAWGCVSIEVKYAKQRPKGNLFQWNFTPKQQEMGISGDLVILMKSDTETTFHIFPADHPIFYRHGKLKTAISYIENPRTSRHTLPGLVHVTKELMDAHQDAVELIETVRITLSKQMRDE